MVSHQSRVNHYPNHYPLEHAGKHPHVVLEALSVTAVGDAIYRIRARVANRGAFPTHVTVKGRALSRLRPVRVEFHPAADVDLLSLHGHVDVGHLDGVTGSRSLEWFVSAPETSRQVLCEIRVLGGTGGNVCREVSRPT